ncbi:MAG: hypothetical protein JNJ73_02420 [Hyphomonadaceae bacterium]|nr:hypothetical protein [Hyphomonadaceae bacterium]
MCLACDYMEMEAAWAEEEERLAAEKAAQATAADAAEPATSLDPVPETAAA